LTKKSDLLSALNISERDLLSEWKTFIKDRDNLTITMSSKQDIINQIQAFKERDKFSTAAWNARGLNPSEKSMCDKLQRLFNDCADAVLKALQSNATPKELRPILNAQLSKLEANEYDTEEKEFIADTFMEIAELTNVDFSKTLNDWLYGEALNELPAMNLSPGIKALMVDCTNAMLETMKLGQSVDQINPTLLAHLAKYNAKDYSVEERDYACKMLSEILKPLKVDITKDLEDWKKGK
jgi:hypothetical protein